MNFKGLKQTLKILTVCLIGVSWAFPAALATLPQNKQDIAQNTSNTTNKATISVITAQSAAKISDQGSVNILSSCFGVVSQTKNLVQDTGVVNLNNPVSCFRFSFQGLTSAPLSLSVKPLAQPKIYIITQALNFSHAPNLTKGPLTAQSIPVLPSVLFILVAVLVSIKKQDLVNLLVKISLNFSSVKSLEKLQVYRC